MIIAKSYNAFDSFMLVCFYVLVYNLRSTNSPLNLTRRLLFWLKVGALQYAILKTALSVLCVVLWTNGNFDLSDVSPDKASRQLLPLQTPAEVNKT